MDYPKIFPMIWNPDLPSLGNCLTVTAEQIAAEVEPLWKNPDQATLPALSQGQFNYVLGKSLAGDEGVTMALSRALLRRQKRGKPVVVVPELLPEVVARRREVRNYDKSATDLCLRTGDAMILLRATMAGRSGRAIETAKALMVDAKRPREERAALSATWWDVIVKQQQPMQLALTKKKSNKKVRAAQAQNHKRVVGQKAVTKAKGGLRAGGEKSLATTSLPGKVGIKGQKVTLAGSDPTVAQAPPRGRARR